MAKLKSGGPAILFNAIFFAKIFATFLDLVKILTFNLFFNYFQNDIFQCSIRIMLNASARKKTKSRMVCRCNGNLANIQQSHVKIGKLTYFGSIKQSLKKFLLPSIQLSINPFCQLHGPMNILYC